MKVSSDKVAVTDAISKVVNLHNQSLTNQSVSLEFSNVSGVKAAAEFSNQLVGDMSKLVDCTFKQTDKIKELAEIMERRDDEDAGSFGF